MRNYLLQFKARRILRGIYFRYEVLKETASAENPDDGQIPRKTSHGFKLLRNDDDFYLMKIYRTLVVAEDSTKFFLYSVFHSLDAK